MRSQVSANSASTNTKTSFVPEKFHVIGAGGFIGGYVVSQLDQLGLNKFSYDLNPSSSSVAGFDITKNNLFDDSLSRIQPGDIIVLAAALPNVEWVELNQHQAAKVNIYGVQHIVDYARLHGNRLIFFSSDYIFDGLHGPYSEDDIPHPLNYYGAQKLSAEYYIRQQLSNYLIIRTTGVFGYEAARKNFLMSFYDRMQKDDPVNIPLDQIATPIYVKDFTHIIIQLALLPRINGVINVVGSELLNRFDLATMISDVFHLDYKKINPLPTAELKQAAIRPLKSGLTANRLHDLGFETLPIIDALKEIASEYSLQL